MLSGDGPLLDYLIVDTGPLIRNIKLDHLARNVVTTPGVVREVRDVHTRNRLGILPFEIDSRLPSEASLRFVQTFAKLTGDIMSLSGTDLAVIALTYELEVSLNGAEHLRVAPLNSIKVNQGFGDENVTNLAGFYLPKKHRSSTSSSISESQPTEVDVTTDDVEITPTEQAAIEGDEGISDVLDKCQLDEGWSTVPSSHKNVDLHEEEIEEEEEDDDDESDEGEWITPSNIQHKKTETLNSIKVGCTTTDFAMQNVLLQIGLHVVSVDGMLIKYAKMYVLKCYACFTVVRDCSKMFCARCGHKTLEKVAVTVDEAGVTWYQRLSKKERSCRGLRFSLPTPKGGRQPNNPHLTEDQPDKKFKLATNIKQNVDVLSSDFVKSGSPFGVTNVDTRAFGYHLTAGRRGNPNERSKNTGNRKKKKR